MPYSRRDFDVLRDELDKKLFRDGEPVSCELYACPVPNGATMRLTNGVEYEHVAEACNIAGVIWSVRRILITPRSNIGCRELSPVLIQTLNTLREFIRDAMGEQDIQPNPKPADRTIRIWANFFKHPGQVVSAHSCISEGEKNMVEVVVNTQKLSDWNDEVKCVSRQEQEDKRKELMSALVGKSVYLELPSIEEITAFFQGSAEHIKRLADKRKRQTQSNN